MDFNFFLVYHITFFRFHKTLFDITFVIIRSLVFHKNIYHKNIINIFLISYNKKREKNYYFLYLYYIRINYYYYLFRSFFFFIYINFFLLSRFYDIELLQAQFKPFIKRTYILYIYISIHHDMMMIFLECLLSYAYNRKKNRFFFFFFIHYIFLVFDQITNSNILD